MDGDDWFPLAELTARLAALAWVEQNLAEVLALWARCDGHAPAAIHFATAGGHHGWHSEVIRGCLATSPQLDAVAKIRPPTTGWQDAITSLVALVEPDATGARLKALTKVVNPWLDREIDALLDLSRPVSDAAMMRWLKFVTHDHDDDGEAVALLLGAQASRAARLDEHVVVNNLDLS